jgi:hypothetical protein
MALVRLEVDASELENLQKALTFIAIAIRPESLRLWEVIGKTDRGRGQNLLS